LSRVRGSARSRLRLSRVLSFVSLQNSCFQISGSLAVIPHCQFGIEHYARGRQCGSFLPNYCTNSLHHRQEHNVKEMKLLNAFPVTASTTWHPNLRDWVSLRNSKFFPAAHSGSGIGSIRPRRTTYPAIPNIRTMVAVTNADEKAWVAETIYPVMMGAEIPPI
jgi:hypothetical protein